MRGVMEEKQEPRGGVLDQFGEAVPADDGKTVGIAVVRPPVPPLGGDLPRCSVLVHHPVGIAKHKFAARPNNRGKG